MSRFTPEQQEWIQEEIQDVLKRARRQGTSVNQVGGPVPAATTISGDMPMNTSFMDVSGYGGGHLRQYTKL